jgi:hypothetical protein
MVAAHVLTDGADESNMPMAGRTRLEARKLMHRTPDRSARQFLCLKGAAVVVLSPLQASDLSENRFALFGPML